MRKIILLTAVFALVIGLDGCGGKVADSKAPDSKVTDSKVTNSREVLRVYNFTEYMDKTTIADFEKEFNIRVIYEEFITNENLIDFHWSGIIHCCICHPGTCGKGTDKIIFGKEFENICLNRGIVFCDPDVASIENIKKIILFRRNEINKMKVQE